MKPIQRRPTLALVGQPNEGKTTVMSTLAEEDTAKVSRTPGETQQATCYPYEIDGEVLLEFWDTPGFQQPSKVLQWLRNHTGTGRILAEQFLATFGGSKEFPDECQILRPLVDGAAAIYVVDASRPVRDPDKQEIEILRLCGFPRIGVINSKDSASEYLAAWKDHMATDFNHYHEFNGHTATFQDRIELLEAVRAVIPAWKTAMNQTLKALHSDWEGRLKEVTDLSLGLLGEIISLSESEPVRHKGDEARAKDEAKSRLMDTLRGKERTLRKKIRELFRHSEEHWAINDLLDDDLFSEVVWRFLGLTKGNLIVAGATIGGIAGAAIDFHALGHLCGVPTLCLTVAGAVLAWSKTDQAVQVVVPSFTFRRLRIPERKVPLGEVKAEAKVLTESNLVWVLLDRILLYVELACSWSHGKREVRTMSVPHGSGKHGPSATWTPDDRGKVGKYLGHVCRKNPSPEKMEQSERALRDMLLSKLRYVTGTLEDS